MWYGAPRLQYAQHCDGACSILKQVTTVAVLQCVELTLDDLAGVECLLQEWNDTKVLTGFTDAKIPISQSSKVKITLGQLLTHTSGLS
jgi:hypothetical protein